MLFEEFQDGHRGSHLWISEWNNFSNSESPCLPSASHQFLLNPTPFGSRTFEDFQEGRSGGHLGYRNGTLLAILKLYVASMPPIKFRLNWTRFRRTCGLKIFKMILAFLNLHVAPMPPTKFELNLS